MEMKEVECGKCEGWGCVKFAEEESSFFGPCPACEGCGSVEVWESVNEEGPKASWEE